MDSVEDPKPFPACTACRCQRKMCGPECVIAPYFPAGSEADFARVDKLFGAKKVTDAINTLHPDLRSTAVESAVYEARAHVDCPPGGPLIVAKALLAELLRRKAELRCVNRKLQELQGVVEAPSSSQSLVDRNLQEVVEESALKLVPRKDVEVPFFWPSLVDEKLQETELCGGDNALHDDEAWSWSQSCSLQQAIRELHDLIAQQEEEEEQKLRANSKANSD